MDPEQDRGVADGGSPALGRTKRPHKIPEGDQIVHLVGDDELLRVEPERVGQRLGIVGYSWPTRMCSFITPWRASFERRYQSVDFVNG